MLAFLYSCAIAMSASLVASGRSNPLSSFHHFYSPLVFVGFAFMVHILWLFISEMLGFLKRCGVRV